MMDTVSKDVDPKTGRRSAGVLMPSVSSQPRDQWRIL